MPLRDRIILIRFANEFHGVCRANNLRRTLSMFRRPKGQTGEEAAVGVFELEEGVGHITAGSRREWE